MNYNFVEIPLDSEDFLCWFMIQVMNVCPCNMQIKKECAKPWMESL